MKKLLFIITITGLIATGCSKKLDIKPTQEIAEEEVFTNDANIKAALNGAYDALSSSSLLGGDMQLYAELLGADDEIRWAGTFNEPREIWNKAILTNNGYVSATWNAAYRAINICNNIINAIEKVNEEDRDRVRGEALFIRGVIYFELVKLYGKPFTAGNTTTNLGVQIVTTPTVGNISDANYVPRSTVQETYDLIVSDLTSAKSLLPEENDIYATTYAASAYLSRVYLQMEDYAKARDEADAVIAGEYYALNDSYAACFNNESNTDEDIFAMQVTAQDGANDMHLFWSIPDFGGRDGDVDVEEKHLDLYEADDERLALFYLDDQDIYRSGKWKIQYRNLPVLRLAEMYLTRAECNFRLGTDIGDSPENDVNLIRSRAGLGSLEGLSLDDIILERHLELAHEGQRVHDIKRLKGSADGFSFDANEMVFPIPISQINAVGADILEQNDGY